MASLPAELRTMMMALARQMADHGYERNYRRAIIEGLDVSPAARMMRGYEQGFHRPQYHGTSATLKNNLRTGEVAPDPLSKVDPSLPTAPFREFTRDGNYEMGIHTATEPETAENRVRHRLPPYVLPLVMRAENELELPDFGNFASPSMLISAITREGARIQTPTYTQKAGLNIPKALFDDLVKAAAETRREAHEEPADMRRIWPERFRAILRKHGFDAVAYRNTVEAQGDSEVSRMGLEPNQYRSVNAMFNPKRRDRKDLMAALAIALGGLGGAQLARDKRRRRG